MFHSFMQNSSRKNDKHRVYYDFFHDDEDFSDESFEDFEFIFEHSTDYNFRPFSNRARTRKRKSRQKAEMHMTAKQTAEAKKKKEEKKKNKAMDPQPETATKKNRTRSMKRSHVFKQHRAHSQRQDKDDKRPPKKREDAWLRATQWRTPPPQKKKDANAYFASASQTKDRKKIKGNAVRAGSNYDGSSWSKSLRAQSVNGKPHSARRSKKKDKDTKDGVIW